MRTIEEFDRLLTTYEYAREHAPENDPGDTAICCAWNNLREFVTAGLAAEAERDAWREECAAMEAEQRDAEADGCCNVGNHQHNADFIAVLPRRVAARTGG